MTPHITITDESIDGLTVHEWVFYLMDDNLVLYLDRYRIGTRTRCRHKLKYDTYYNRIGRTAENVSASHEVPIPDKVRAAAVEQVVSMVRVDLWENRRR